MDFQLIRYCIDSYYLLASGQEAEPLEADDLFDDIDNLIQLFNEKSGEIHSLEDLHNTLDLGQEIFKKMVELYPQIKDNPDFLSDLNERRINISDDMDAIREDYAEMLDNPQTQQIERKMDEIHEFRKQKRREKWQGLSLEQRREISRKHHEKLMEKWKANPEVRDKRLEQMKEYDKKRFERQEAYERRKEQMKAYMKNLTPEQKTELNKKRREKRLQKRLLGS